VIDILVGAGFRVKKCCEVLGVSSAGYYLAKTRPMSPTKIRREWLTGVIREVHAVSRGTYGSRRVHAELTKGRGVHVSRVLVTILMHDAEIAGIPGPRKVKRIKGNPTSDDLVQRKFERSSLDELWVTDITEHPTREGKVYCCCVLDTCSRRIVGWSIDSAQDTTLVVNALDMAIKQRRVKKGSVVHADHGTQGEFNWSSQHLNYGGVNGQASWVDERVNGEVTDEVAGCALASKGSRARILA
jgi:transposase InsO family protein